MRSSRSAARSLPATLRRVSDTLRAPPNRRAACRRGAAVLVAIGVMTVAGTTHRRGLELAERWGKTTSVLVIDAPVAIGDPVDGHVRSAQVPTFLVPPEHLTELPSDARAATGLTDGEILTRQRLLGHGDRSDAPPGQRRALVPVPLVGREGAAPSELAVGDVVDVIAPGPPTASGGRGPTRTVATDALVRSVDPTAVTLEVATVDVAELADALLGGPVVLTVVAAPAGRSAAGRSDVVDDE